MPSRSLTAPRRIPQQKRGQRRVAGLLDAAAGVMAETGYQATTMCAIAERAGSSIGSLYQFFPNKEAVAEELRGQYVKELERLWATLAREAAALPAGDLVDRLIESQIRFAEAHPAFLALLDAPPTRNTLRRRELIRTRIARVILIRKPDMPRSKAFRSAAVVQQIVRGLLTLYARADKGEKSAMLEEFKAVLTGYLAPQW
ncbi:MAG TPA: TetR/AcrR family transcriptional regulator [Terriglobia bacterium]|nr:TetR/AcrR family transcriptional regulator [Terriglobia bacterium]